MANTYHSVPQRKQSTVLTTALDCVSYACFKKLRMRELEGEGGEGMNDISGPGLTELWRLVGSAVGSAGLSYLFYCNVRDGVARLPNSLVLLPSVALTLFLLYNVAAGGNPPKKAQEA